MSEKAGSVQWIQDGAGVWTCHINDGALDFKQSRIGSLKLSGEQWHAILNDGKDLTPDGCSYAQARDAMVSHYCADKQPEVKPVKVDRTTPRRAQRDKYVCTCREKELDKTNCPKHREFG